MPEIIRITSEALQQTIRNLLPSQTGFGEDLHAQNVVVPIIDLTPTAEGSVLRQDLQTAVSHTDATEFNVSNTSTVVANSAGFYRLIGSYVAYAIAAGGYEATVQVNDGSTSKTVWGAQPPAASANEQMGFLSFDLVVFLTPGDDCRIVCDARARMRGSIRQIADVYGNLNAPTGYNPQ